MLPDSGRINTIAHGVTLVLVRNARPQEQEFGHATTRMLGAAYLCT